MEKNHKAVLLEEVLETFESHIAPLHTSIIVDTTLGLGGHSSQLIKKGYYVVGIETDLQYISQAKENLSKACPPTFEEKESGCFQILHGNFRDIDVLLANAGYNEVDGILMDLGVNSPQLLSSSRGMSFQYKDASLDMRLDTSTQGVTAADLLNTLREDQLISLFETIMDYRDTRYLVNKITRYRNNNRFITVDDFLKLLPQKIGTHIHPATKPFLALRIAVNSELQTLESALPKCLKVLKKDGVLLVISFHSGEDAIVKDFIKQKCNEGLIADITKKPVVPTQKELDENKRARSAKLRIVKKLKENES